MQCDAHDRVFFPFYTQCNAHDGEFFPDDSEFPRLYMQLNASNRVFFGSDSELSAIYMQLHACDSNWLALYVNWRACNSEFPAYSMQSMACKSRPRGGGAFVFSAAMTDDPTSIPPPAASDPPLPAAPDATVLLDTTAVLGAVSDPARYAILLALAEGKPLSVQTLAARLGKSPDLVSKHLKNLREARMVMAVASPDGDGRKTFHEIPALFIQKDAAGRTLMDFGAVLLRV